MSLHVAALALVDRLAAEGVTLTAAADGAFDQLGPDASDGSCGALEAFLGPAGVHSGSTPRRALRAVLRAQGRPAREFLACPVAAVRLQVRYTATLDRLTCSPTQGRKHVGALFTTSREVYELRRLALPVFTASELVCAALAYERGIAGPVHLDRWLAAKARGRWQLLPELAGLPPLPTGAQPPTPTITVGELFDGLGFELGLLDFHASGSASEVAA